MVSEIIVFEIAVIISLIGAYLAMDRVGYDKLGKKFLMMILVVTIIELFSMPFWSNSKLDSWAFVYKDLSWILIILWVDIAFISIMIVDRAWGRRHEKQRFWFYFIFIAIFRFALEWVLLKAKIRKYDPSLTDVFNNSYIPVLDLPLALILVIIIIAIFTVTLYKYTSEYLFRNLNF